MRDRTGGGAVSGQARPTRSEARPETRNRHRLHGWMIAIAVSALLWSGIVWIAWSLVAALI